MNIGYSILKVVLIFESVVMLGIITLGPYSIMIIKKQEQREAEYLQITHTLNEQILELTQQIEAWNTDPFYKEKIAREQLQLARPNDEIYFVLENKVQ